MVIWREGEEQTLLRNQIAAQLLLDYNRHIYAEDDDNCGFTDSSTEGLLTSMDYYSLQKMPTLASAKTA